MKNRFFIKNTLYFTISILIIGNIFVWKAIAVQRGGNSELYFFNVGQGDSQFIEMPGGAQILIDGGRGPRALIELGKVMLPTDRYIDLVILTHPDFDHFGGLIDVLKNYRVGAVITNGRKGIAAAYADFEKAVKENGASQIVLSAGDKIKHQNAVFNVLWPLSRGIAENKNINELGIVMMFQEGLPRALFTADIGWETEKKLAAKYDLSADILKVAHHGSKYSSDLEFLSEVRPKISVIGVGKNSYGHPTREVLNRLADIGALTLRTDLAGTIKVIFENGALKAYGI